MAVGADGQNFEAAVPDLQRAPAVFGDVVAACDLRVRGGCGEREGKAERIRFMRSFP